MQAKSHAPAMTTPSYSFESNAEYLQSSALLAQQGDEDFQTNWGYGSTPTSLKNPTSKQLDGHDSSSVTPYTLFKKAKQRSVDNESPSCVQDLEDGFLATDTHKLLSVTKKLLISTLPGDLPRVSFDVLLHPF